MSSAEGQSTPESRLESRPESTLESRLEPRPESRLDSTLESRPQPRLESRPESRLDSTLESRPQPRLESRPEPRLDSTLESRPQPRLESRPDSALEPRPQPRLESRPDSTLESRPESTLESRPESTLESRPESTLESRPESTLESTLKSGLEALECHFTWNLDSSRSFLTRRMIMLEDIGTNEGNLWMGHIYNLLGFIHYKLGAPEAAQQFLDSATEAFRRLKGANEGPWLVVNYGNLAWLHHFLGHDDLSQEYLSKVENLITKYPSPQDTSTAATPSQDELNPEICAEKAWTLMKFYKDQKLQAADLFQRAFRLQPDMVHWHTSHVLAMTSAHKHSDEDMDDAVWEEMRRAIDQDPDSYLVAVELLLRAKRNEDVRDEADELAEVVLQKPIGSYSGIKVLLRVYRQLGLIDEALNLAERALNDHPDERYLKRIAALCYKWKILFFRDTPLPQDKMDRAISLYEQVLDSYPGPSLMKNVDLANILARSRGGLDRADQKYQNLLRMELEPMDKQLVYNNYAKYLNFDKKDRDQSIRYHMKVVKIPLDSHFRQNSIKVLERIAERGRNRKCREIRMFLDKLQPV